jgi:hypothetical protein
MWTRAVCGIDRSLSIRSHTGSQCRPIGIAGQCTFLSSQLMKNFAMSALFFSDII